MKIRRILSLAFFIAVTTPFVSSADELYQLSWRGTAYTTGPDGNIVARPVSEKDFINKIAIDNGITDVQHLAFVYRPDKHDTAVVWTTTGAFVADVIQMEYSFTDVSNSSGTQTARQAFLFDEYHSGPIGSAFGLEKAIRNTEGVLTSYSFRGTFQYAMPDTGTVYSGIFRTSNRIKDTSG